MKEEWKPIKGYEELYLISNKGNLYSCYTKALAKNHLNKRGYVYLGLTKNKKFKHEYAHRAVAKAFIPNPENKPEVNHINSIKHDNRVENLEWVTHKENMQHALKCGEMSNPSGFKAKRAKITPEQCKIIRSSKDKVAVLAKRFNVCIRTIYNHKKKGGYYPTTLPYL
ncbi:MAG: NUMOD4 domain-containing protein [Pseudoalteromonas sp.]